MEPIEMSKEMLELYLKDEEHKVVIERDKKYYDIENGDEIEVVIRGGADESKI